MLKLKAGPGYMGPTVEVGRLFAIDENDRGDWREGEGKPLACEEFVGFHGENVLIVIPMGMQSGRWDVVVVHSCVDNPLRVGRAQGEIDHEDLIAVANSAIAQVCDYPESL